MRTAIITFALLLSFTARTLAEDPAAADPRAAPKLNALLEPIRAAHKLPALAGAIVTSKGLVAAGAVGVRKAGEKTPVTVHDLWHLGSNTKAMTAALTGELVEEGKLRWDSTPAEVFPDLAAEFTPEFAGTTLTQLLSHRAGLPSDFESALYNFSSPRSARLSAVKSIGALKLKSKPGEKYSYTNLGYVVAGAMAEQVTSQSWEELTTAKIFKPLEMKTAGFGGVGSAGQLDQPWWHGPGAVPAPFHSTWTNLPTILGPAGNVHASLDDWSKFIADQLRGGQGQPALLKPETYTKLQAAPVEAERAAPATRKSTAPATGESAKPANAEPAAPAAAAPPAAPPAAEQAPPSVEYALGWAIYDRRWGGGKVLTHSGSNDTNYSVIWLTLNRDFAVLACTNQGGADSAKACDELAAALIEFHLGEMRKANEQKK